MGQGWGSLGAGWGWGRSGVGLGWGRGGAGGAGTGVVCVPMVVEAYGAWEGRGG